MAIATPGPRVAIDAPPPIPPLYTIITAATAVTEANERWAVGAGVRGYPCARTSAWPVCPDDALTKDVISAGTVGTVDGFAVYLAWECTTRGWDDADQRQRLLTAFAAGEAAGVERGVWDGYADGIHLASAAAAQPGGATAYSPSVALALLEQAIADGGASRGIIHAPPRIVSGWSAAQLLVEDARQLRTRLGTLIVPGYGYSGELQGEAATSPTSGWAVATGQIALRRGPIVPLPDEPAEYIDRSVNTATIYAERDYLVVADLCTHAAVLVDLTA